MSKHVQGFGVMSILVVEHPGWCSQMQGWLSGTEGQA